jgi:hypothetical protein
MDMVTHIIGTFAPNQQMPVFAKSVPPVGFAAQYSAASLDGHVVIPAATMQGIAEFVRQTYMARKAPPQDQ